MILKCRLFIDLFTGTNFVSFKMVKIFRSLHSFLFFCLVFCLKEDWKMKWVCVCVCVCLRKSPWPLVGREDEGVITWNPSKAGSNLRGTRVFHSSESFWDGSRRSLRHLLLQPCLQEGNTHTHTHTHTPTHTHTQYPFCPCREQAPANKRSI